METSNESNAISILSWIFDELDTQKFGIKNNKHFNYFDDSEENIQKINHFYLNLKHFIDINIDEKARDDTDGEDDLGVDVGRQIKSNSNGNNKKKNRPNQGDTGDFADLRKKRNPSAKKKEKEKKEKESNDDLNDALSSNSTLSEKDKIKTKNLNFEGFNANVSLNPEENRIPFCNNKELRKFKSDFQISSVRNQTALSKIARSFSSSAIIPPIPVNLSVNFTNFVKEKENPTFFNSSNRSLFNSSVLSDNTDSVTDEFPDDSKLDKNDEIDNETFLENKDDIINSKKIKNSIKNTDIILEEIMVSPTSSNNSLSSSTTAINSNSKNDIIKISLESVMTSTMSKDELEDGKNHSAFILNEYGQSLFRLRYYLLQLKYLIDCNKDLEQIVFYKLALSQYPDSNSVRTWLKRRITREPLVHGYCLPPFSSKDESLTNDMFSRPLKNKIFHSLSLDKKYQVVEPLSFEFDRKVMGTPEHKSLVSCNSNLKYCQMRQRSDIVLRTIFIKHLFQQAPAVKRIIGNERFLLLKDKALLNLQPRASKHYKPKENISNSMISIKLKTNKKMGIYLQHHSKKSSIDFSSRNMRQTNGNIMSPQPVDSINNNLKGINGSTYNRRFEKSKSYQNVFFSNSPSKLRNCHMLEPTPTHKHSYSQPLSHIIFNKQNNQYSIEPIAYGNPNQRFINKEKASFLSKYIFSNNNYGNINNFNFHKSNSNLMTGNNNVNNNNNNNNVIVVTNINGLNTAIVNNNMNVQRNNRSINLVKSEITLNNSTQPGINRQYSINNNNINNNMNPYGYRKQHRHISSISSVKDIKKDMDTCYNINNLKSNIDVSKAKLNNNLRNLNNNLRNLNTISPSTTTERSHSDISSKYQPNGYDISNTNRKVRDIKSQKSLNSITESDNDSKQENFNQSDVINNYSDQDSVYSLSSLYSIDKENSDNQNINKNEQKDESPDREAINSNKTLVVYKHHKKASVIKKIFGIMKTNKKSEKSKKSKNNPMPLSSTVNKSNNIVDSEETINNSMEIARFNPNHNIRNSNFSVNSDSSVKNSNFSVNTDASISNSNFSVNTNSYNSNETIHEKPRSAEINKKVIMEKGGNGKVKRSSSKWHIHLFGKSSKKTTVSN